MRLGSRRMRFIVGCRLPGTNCHNTLLSFTNNDYPKSRVKIPNLSILYLAGKVTLHTDTERHPCKD